MDQWSPLACFQRNGSFHCAVKMGGDPEVLPVDSKFLIVHYRYQIRIEKKL